MYIHCINKGGSVSFFNRPGPTVHEAIEQFDNEFPCILENWKPVAWSSDEQCPKGLTGQQSLQLAMAAGRVIKQEPAAEPEAAAPALCAADQLMIDRDGPVRSKNTWKEPPADVSTIKPAWAGVMCSPDLRHNSHQVSPQWAVACKV